MKKSGLTLVELLVSISIIAILIVMAVAAFNPSAQVRKANDARRKSDLGQVKVAFEEYFNDEGCYPSNSDPKYPNILSDLGNKSNCGSSLIFSNWGISSWPCDPVTKFPYDIYVDVNTPCPSWFKLLTNLENKKDSQIPIGWYSSPSPYSVDGGNSVHNFGVSSPNVSWFDQDLGPECQVHTQCFGNYSGWVPLGPGQFCQMDIYPHSLATDPDNQCMVQCCDNGHICSGSICQ